MKRLLVFCLLGLMACEEPHESVARFHYTKDPKTNQCFALYSMGTQSASFSYVPCTPEVEAEIKFEETGRH